MISDLSRGNLKFLKSYFPEKKRKNYINRIFDNLLWLIKNCEINNFYTLYGLDLKYNRNQNFISYKKFMETRFKKNKHGNPNSQTVILRDKFLFYLFLKNFNIATPEVFGVIKDGQLFDTKLQLMSKEKINNLNDFFVKEANGECASFVKHFNNIYELENYADFLNSGIYIIQKRLIQCDKMSLLYHNSVNTIRIVTVCIDGNCKVFSALLRVGTEKSNNVDNWAAGGLAIGIDGDGKLKEYGYFKPIHGLKTKIHPDSKLTFNEFQLPFYKDVIKLVIDAHKKFYTLHSIGWDVAITNEGPVIIEGNDNWEISLHQAVEEGLKKQWENVIK